MDINNLLSSVICSSLLLASPCFSFSYCSSMYLSLGLSLFFTLSSTPHSAVCSPLSCSLPLCCPVSIIRHLLLSMLCSSIFVFLLFPALLCFPLFNINCICPVRADLTHPYRALQFLFPKNYYQHSRRR